MSYNVFQRSAMLNMRRTCNILIYSDRSHNCERDALVGGKKVLTLVSTFSSGGPQLFIQLALLFLYLALFYYNWSVVDSRWSVLGGRRSVVGGSSNTFDILSLSEGRQLQNS
jgi:hypothetical protein